MAFVSQLPFSLSVSREQEGRRAWRSDRPAPHGADTGGFRGRAVSLLAHHSAAFSQTLTTKQGSLHETPLTPFRDAVMVTRTHENTRYLVERLVAAFGMSLELRRNLRLSPLPTILSPTLPPLLPTLPPMLSPTLPPIVPTLPGSAPSSTDTETESELTEAFSRLRISKDSTAGIAHDFSTLQVSRDPAVSAWLWDLDGSSTFEPEPVIIISPTPPLTSAGRIGWFRGILIMCMFWLLWSYAIHQRFPFSSGVEVHAQIPRTKYSRPTIRSMEIPSTPHTGYIVGGQVPTRMLVPIQLSDIPQDKPGKPVEVIFDTGATRTTADKGWLLEHCPGCQPMPLAQPHSMQGIAETVMVVHEFVYADLIFKGHTKTGPVDVRVAATIELLEGGSQHFGMLLGMDVAHLHKIDVSQKRKKLIFREAQNAQVDFIARQPS